LKDLGCETVIVVGASGSLDPDIKPGRIVLIKDHINFQFNNPLIGIEEACPNNRFIDMSSVYDADHRKTLLALADKRGIQLSEGVYVGTLGPCFETPAEIRAYRRLGADIVGMSTIPEVVVARYYGLRVMALSAITNLAAGLKETPLDHDVTLAGVTLAIDDLSQLILAFLEGST